MGEGGCESLKKPAASASSSASSTESGFLELFLEKNFIEVDSANLKASRLLYAVGPQKRRPLGFREVTP